MINCMIMDDEPLAIQLLGDYVQKLPFLNLVGKFNEPMEALDFMNSNEVDLIFLDIKMPDISGIDFFKSLQKKPELILITAYSDFALQGFELNAVDYLLKPVSFERFVASVNRAREVIEYKQNKQKTKDYFFINVSHKIQKILYNDILYLEGYKDYTKIHLSGQAAPVLVLHNLKYFEDFLHDSHFIRVHRSYIVPFQRIQTISRRSVSIGQTSIPVSDNYRERLFSNIE